MTPTGPGYYWVKNLKRGSVLLVGEGIVEVDQYYTTSGMYVRYGVLEADLESLTGMFVGPLVSPW